MSVLVAKEAPDFTAPAVMPDGVIKEDFKLSDLKGKYVVLFFWPLDFTFVCPTEIIAHNKRMEQFKGRSVEVVGVSIDSQFTHFAWRSTAVNDGKLIFTSRRTGNFEIWMAESDGSAARQVSQDGYNAENATAALEADALDDVIAREREVLENLTRNEGKPEQAIEKIVKGRIQITANWHDSLDRLETIGVYGTNGGSDFDRDGLSAPSSSSSSVERS